MSSCDVEMAPAILNLAVASTSCLSNLTSMKERDAQDDGGQAEQELSMSSSPEADSRLPLRSAAGVQTVQQSQPSKPLCRVANGHPVADVVPQPAQVRAGSIPAISASVDRNGRFPGRQ